MKWLLLYRTVPALQLPDHDHAGKRRYGIPQNAEIFALHKRIHQSFDAVADLERRSGGADAIIHPRQIGDLSADRPCGGSAVFYLVSVKETGCKTLIIKQYFFLFC